MTIRTHLPAGRRISRMPVRNTLALATALALAGFAGHAQAFSFGSSDGFSGTVNTTIGYGMAWRTQDPSDDLIGKAQFNPLVSALGLGSQAQRDARGRYSVNGDDGDLAYDKWDPISNALNLTVEVSLNYGPNWGAFVRGYGFYDFENNDRDDLSNAAKNRVGTQTRILDAFVFHNFNAGGRQGTIRVGQQVVSWGESTFIQGGINAINPVDVSKLRVAGAELKQAFLPVNMLWGSYNLTDNLSMEALYMLDFRRTDPDPVGTYFSTNDFAVIGGRYVMLNFGTVPQPVINPDLYNEVCVGGNYGASDAGLPAALVAAGCSAAFPRSKTRDPSKTGQGGLAFRYLAEGLNNTEFGFYALNYHSRVPLISGISVTGQAPNTGSYFTEYPEDIRMYGVSFNTQLQASGIALQGELSYRPNQPFQVDDVELLFAGLSPLNVLLPQPYLRFVSQLGQYGPGEEIRGYERHKITQLQLTATKVLGPGNFMGSDQLALVGEVGFTNVQLPDNLRFNGDGTDTGGGPDVNSGSGRNPITQAGGFPTDFSWGYRLAMRADYNNLWGTPFNVSPRLAFNHDVKGYTPGPGGSFVEGRKSVTIGAETTYLNQWTFDLAYTNFFGGGSYNLIHDRDFVQIAARYSF
ncbi:DUF1302 domain-containing protein [Dokdonella sp. MW10]|uniref:DUF1302 domain-containing protein n=1 Tax=Dokdonella sp. MW10 TaxID=2992926 RepID=UPI003F7F202E